MLIKNLSTIKKKIQFIFVFLPSRPSGSPYFLITSIWILTTNGYIYCITFSISLPALVLASSNLNPLSMVEISSSISAKITKTFDKLKKINLGLMLVRGSQI